MSSTQSHMDNFTRARLNMIESQIRAGGVTNQQVIAAMADLPRESFVPSEQGLLAYAETDAALSTGDAKEARYLLSPPLLARLVDAAGIHEGDLVLDIGCASGYSTAILAQLVGMGTVVGLEKDAALAEQATHMLERLDLDNTVIIMDRLDEGYPAQGPYNVILLNGASARPPEDLAALFAAQLCDGGRFVGVFDDGGDIKGQAWLFTKNGDEITRAVLFDARAPILPGFEAQPTGFRFPGISKKPTLEEISAKPNESSASQQAASQQAASQKSAQENWQQDSENKTLDPKSPAPQPSSGESEETAGSSAEMIPPGSLSKKAATLAAAPTQDKLRVSADSAANTTQEIKRAESDSKEAALSKDSSGAPQASSKVRASAPATESRRKEKRKEKRSRAKSLDPRSKSEPASVWPRVPDARAKMEPPSASPPQGSSDSAAGEAKASELEWPPKAAAPAPSPEKKPDAQKNPHKNKSGK